MPQVPRTSARFALPLLAALAGCTGLPAARDAVAAEAPSRDAGGAPDVTVTVVKVRAAGVAQPGAKPSVDPSLGHIPIHTLHLNYASYAHAGTSVESVRWGERVRVDVGGGGTFDVWPAPGKDADHVLLKVSETGPGKTEACSTGHVEVVVNRRSAWFCDGVPRDGTLLFFVVAEPFKR